MGKLLILAAYLTYAAFWIRFAIHTLIWWRATRRLKDRLPSGPLRAKACLLTITDAVFFARLLMVNPALWLGEWIFHLAFVLVILRHLRFFLNPVPDWVWSIQLPGMIAGYILPISLIYILVVRLVTKREKYASPANVFLLTLVLITSSIGVIMNLWYKPNLVDVKLFALAITKFTVAAAPQSILFVLHFILFLILIPFLPTHIFTAPFVMMEARKREQTLHLVMHEQRENSGRR